MMPETQSITFTTVCCASRAAAISLLLVCLVLPATALPLPWSMFTNSHAAAQPSPASSPSSPFSSSSAAHPDKIEEGAAHDALAGTGALVLMVILAVCYLAAFEFVCGLLDLRAFRFNGVTVAGGSSPRDPHNDAAAGQCPIGQHDEHEGDIAIKELERLWDKLPGEDRLVIWREPEFIAWEENIGKELERLRDVELQRDPATEEEIARLKEQVLALEKEFASTKALLTALEKEFASTKALLTASEKDFASTKATMETRRLQQVAHEDRCRLEKEGLERRVNEAEVAASRERRKCDWIGEEQRRSGEKQKLAQELASRYYKSVEGELEAARLLAAKREGEASETRAALQKVRRELLDAKKAAIVCGNPDAERVRMSVVDGQAIRSSSLPPPPTGRTALRFAGPSDRAGKCGGALARHGRGSIGKDGPLSSKESSSASTSAAAGSPDDVASALDGGGGSSVSDEDLLLKEREIAATKAAHAAATRRADEERAAVKRLQAKWSELADDAASVPCAVCFSQSVETAAVPCGHMYACKACADTMQARAGPESVKCGICRAPAHFFQRIHWCPAADDYV